MTLAISGLENLALHIVAVVDAGVTLQLFQIPATDFFPLQAGFEFGARQGDAGLQ
jgi:hypothetical protein